MAYKNKEKQKEKQKEYYQKIKEKKKEYYKKNREKKIKYQREWDKNNKDKKKLQDSKRYGTEEYNIKQSERLYSRNHYKKKLLEKYGGCQFCGSKIKLEVHHREYKRSIKYCILLCQKCHKYFHSQHSCTAIKSNGGIL